MTTPARDILTGIGERIDRLEAEQAKLQESVEAAHGVIRGQQEILDDHTEAVLNLTAKLDDAYRRIYSLETGQPLPAPTPDPPGDVTAPPDTGTLPVRNPGKPLKNQSGRDLYLSDPQRYDRDPAGEDTAGVWLNESGVYNVTNLETQNIGGEGGSWQHSIFSGGGGKDITLNLTDFWAHDLTRSERLSRDHLALYADATTLNAARMLIGEPGDTHPPDIPVKLTCYRDATPRPAVLDTLLSYNSRRVLVEARVGTTSPVSSLRVRNAIIVNPLGDGHGGAEFFDLANIPDVDIDRVFLIDTTGKLRRPTIVKAKNCGGRVRNVYVYGPNLEFDAPYVTGFDGVSVQRINLPATPAPDWHLDNFDALVKHYGGAG